MQLDINLLRSFVAIAENGSFIAAAERVAKSPSSITMQIKRLEDIIGEPLFHRDARTTRLTRAGERLLPQARRMLSMEAEILAAFQGDDIQGEVRLGVPDDVVERFPMQTLSMIRDKHPNLILTVNVDHTPALLSKVEKGTIDLAVITFAPSIPGVSKCERIWHEPEVWATSKTGIASERSPLPVILWEEGWAWYQDAIDVLDEADVEYKIVLQCENIGARRKAIMADLGIGPLPISQLGDDLIPAPNMTDLSPLPDYGLGLKLPKRPTAAVKTVTGYIRETYAGGDLPRS
ncbi:MAG: LysR family transcriptional regulator [Pseudomonadota bacterium]